MVKPGIALDSEWRDRAGLNGCGPAEGSYMKHCTEGHTNTSVFVGTAYSQTLSASGTAPYTWTIAKGALPGGLSLDASSGSISVTPTAAGTSSVTIQVTDSTKATASAAFTLTVISASFSGLSSTATAAQQLSGTLAPGAAYPQEITGQVTLAFQPYAFVGFAGGRSIHPVLDWRTHRELHDTRQQHGAGAFLAANWDRGRESYSQSSAT